MQRDTDKDWNIIAENSPYFGVLSNEQFQNPTEHDLNTFFSSGRTDVENMMNIIKHDHGNFSPKTVLDFGCGVGRLLIPMSRLSGKGVGVDIADGMLDLARHHIANSGVNATVQNSIPSATFDWVNSFIVLQHIPPPRGYEIIERLWSATAVGGILSFHVTIFKEQRHTAELQNRIKRYTFDGESVSLLEQHDGDTGSMTMFDYNLAAVMSKLNLVAGQTFRAQYTIHGGCHGINFFVHKPS